MKPKIPLFARFVDKGHLNDMIKTISRRGGKGQKEVLLNEITILLGCFEQTIINGYRDDDEDSTED